MINERLIDKMAAYSFITLGVAEISIAGYGVFDSIQREPSNLPIAAIYLAAGIGMLVWGKSILSKGSLESLIIKPSPNISEKENSRI